MQLSCQEPKMKMYISSLVMGRMEKKRKPCAAIAKILVSCQRWFGHKAKPQDHTGSCEQEPIPVRPSTTGSHLVFPRTSELPQVTAHHAVSVTWCCVQGGAACSGSFVQSPSWAHWCNPKATARQGKGQLSWWSQSCPRKTH